MNLLDRYHNKILFGLLVAIMALLPFNYKLTNALLGIAAFISLITALRQPFSFRQLSPLMITIIGFFILDLIGIFYSENIREAYFTIDKHQFIVYSCLLFLVLRLTDRERTLSLTAFVSGCTIASVICIVVNVQISIAEYKEVFHEWRFSHDRFSSPIGMTAVYFGLYVSLALVILADRIIASQVTLTRFLLSILFLYLSGVLIATGARAAITSSFLIIIARLMYLAIIHKRYYFVAIACCLPIMLASLIYFNPVVSTRFLDITKRSYEESNYGSYFARLYLWQPAFEVIKENLWFGVGSGDAQDELNKKFVESGFLEGKGFNTHNQYLQSMVQFGFPGVGLLVLAIVLNFRASFLRHDFLYAAFTTLFAAACITESLLYRNKGLMFFLLFSFIFFYTSSISDNTTKNHDHGKR